MAGSLATSTDVAVVGAGPTGLLGVDSITILAVRPDRYYLDRLAG